MVAGHHDRCHAGLSCFHNCLANVRPERIDHAHEAGADELNGHRRGIGGIEVGGVDVGFKWLPGARYVPFGESVFDHFKHMLLPAVSLALGISAVFMRLLRSDMIGTLRQPFIVLIAVPLSVIGVTLGLLVTGTPFSFMVFIGIVSLTGIVVNDGIVLIDSINR